MQPADLMLCVITQPVMAGNILEPELLEITDDWLTSDPQPGVDYHVFKVCRDGGMTLDFAQGIYRARDNGAVWIPANNRCIYRVQSSSYYNLFYQIQAGAVDGARSQWTPPRKLLVSREVMNVGSQSYSYTLVNYETGYPLSGN